MKVDGDVEQGFRWLVAWLLVPSSMLLEPAGRLDAGSRRWCPCLLSVMKGA